MLTNTPGYKHTEMYKLTAEEFTVTTLRIMDNESTDSLHNTMTETTTSNSALAASSSIIMTVQVAEKMLIFTMDEMTTSSI